LPIPSILPNTPPIAPPSCAPLGTLELPPELVRLDELLLLELVRLDELPLLELVRLDELPELLPDDFLLLFLAAAAPAVAAAIPARAPNKLIFKHLQNYLS
jgi:hypothetical protein